MARGVAALVSSQTGAAAVSLLATALAARQLGPADFGLAALVMSYPELVMSFVSIRSYSITSRYIAMFLARGEHDKLRSMCKLGYTMDFAAAVLAFVLVGGTSWWVAKYLTGTPGMAWLMIAYAASFPLGSFLATSWAAFTASHRFDWVATLQLLDRGLASAMAVVFLLAGFGVKGLVLGMAVGRAMVGLLALVVTTTVLSPRGFGAWWRASLSPVGPLRKEITALFGWNFVIVTLSGITAQAPVILLGRLRGPGEAGFFRLAVGITAAGSVLETSLGRVAYPILASRWALGERIQLTETLKRWTLRTGLAACAALLLTIPLLPIAIPRIFGPTFEPAVGATQMLMAGAAGSAALFWLTSFYYASGRVSVWAKAYGLYAVGAIGIGWLFTEQWGFFGLAVVTTVAKLAFIVGLAAGLLPGSPLYQGLASEGEAVSPGPAG